MLKKKHHLGWALTALFAFTFAASAELGDPKKLPPASDKVVDFKKHIKPLLEKSCLKCHSGRRPKSKYRMDTLENTVKGGSSDEAAIVKEGGKFVSAKSPFVHYIADLVEELEMPPVDKRDRYPQIKKEQVSLIRAWIDQGAKWPKDVVLAAPAAE